MIWDAIDRTVDLLGSRYDVQPYASEGLACQPGVYRETPSGTACEIGGERAWRRHGEREAIRMRAFGQRVK